MMIVTALMLAATVSAQPALTKGMEGKRLSEEELTAMRYIGVQNNLDAWIMEGRRHVKQIVLTDVNLETVSVAPIEGSGNKEVLTASIDGYRTGVLLVERSNRRTAVLRCEVDADSRAMVESYDTVVVFDYGRKDNCMVWSATSPSGNYSALICVVQMNESSQYSTFAALFDSRMRKIWDKEYALGSLHDVFVTDGGCVVTLGEEREEAGSHFIFNVLDSVRAVSYDAAVKCDPVKELHLANVVGSRAIAVGTYRSEGGKKAEKLTAGVLSMAFDIDSAVLAGITMRPFQNEDMNIFLNMKTKKIQKEQECDHIVTLGCVATPYGAVLALGRNMEVEKSSNSGSVSREGYATGVHLVAVDTSGRVRWVRNLRRNDVNEDGVPTLGIACSGYKVCVVKSEHAKMPTIYDISDEAKQFKQGNKGCVAMYSVDPDGNTARLLLETKSKLTVFRAYSRLDGTLVYFGVRGNKTRMAELRW